MPGSAGKRRRPRHGPPAGSGATPPGVGPDGKSVGRLWAPERVVEEDAVAAAADGVAVVDLAPVAADEPEQRRVTHAATSPVVVELVWKSGHSSRGWAPAWMAAASALHHGIPFVAPAVEGLAGDTDDGADGRGGELAAGLEVGAGARVACARSASPRAGGMALGDPGGRRRREVGRCARSDGGWSFGVLGASSGRVPRAPTPPPSPRASLRNEASGSLAALHVPRPQVGNVRLGPPAVAGCRRTELPSGGRRSAFR